VRAGALLLALLICACAAPAPGAPAPLAYATPSCREARHAGEAALLQSLFGAGYDCAEELAAALAARPGAGTVPALLAMAAPPNHSLARRTALRALGRLAEQPAGSPAARLARETHAAEVRGALGRILAEDADTYVAQDAIWILDTFFFPAREALPQLQAISADPARGPELRARAMNAAARLILARPGRIPPADLGFALRSLASDDAGVRARAALVAERLAPRLPATERALAIIALAEADRRAAAEPLLPPDRPAAILESPGALRFDPLFSGRPDVPATPIAARAAVARALDAYLPDGRFEALLATYEAATLPARLDGPGLSIRAGLPPEALPPLAALVGRTRALFFELLGPSFAQPVPGDANEALRLLVFADQAAYRDYMLAFVGFGAEVDGVYVEEAGALYTYARGADVSRNTLEETVAHEAAHALSGRYLFPGGWRTPGYHAEPKGWADEGLAEYLAGAALAETTGGGLAERRLGALCDRRLPPELGALLGRRAGYDQFGTFAYDEAWALARYLLEDRPEGARRIVAAYRDGSYRAEAMPALAGADTLAELESSWHAAIRRWCGAERSAHLRSSARVGKVWRS
jgi:hypothetical protein